MPTTQPEMLNLIQRHGALYMAQSIDEGGYLFGLRDGIDITNWRAKMVPGAVLFAQVQGGGDATPTTDPAILWVHAPESDRQTWETIARDNVPEGVTVTVIMGGE